MTRRLEFTDDQMEAALRRHNGILTPAAAELGVTRYALTVRIKRHPDRWSDLMAELREGVVDLAEGVLIQGLIEGDKATAFFALRTIGRTRGYAERTEVTGADGGPVEYADARSALAARLASGGGSGGA